jgi:hypothetical protein
MHTWVAQFVNSSMATTTDFLRRWKTALALLGLIAVALISQAQRSYGQAAQIGPSSPLPVFVTNTPPLPEGFGGGSTWKFTTWTAPSVLTWTATVNRTSGPWAYLSVRNENGATSSGWYYVPAMPGSWEKQ